MWRHLWNWSSGRKHDRWHTPAATGSPEKLIEQLRDSSALVRATAADGLGMLGPGAADANAALSKAMRDADESVVMNAAYALAAIGEKSVSALIAGMRDQNEMTSRHAAYALGTVGPTAIEALIDAGGAMAAYALGEIGVADDSIIASLKASAGSDDPTTRITAADSLGMLGEGAAKANSTLVDLMRGDKESEVRFTAARALMRMGKAAADATDALIDALEDENRYVRAYSIEALQRIGTPEAVEALLETLKASRWCPVTALVHPYTP